MTTVRPIVLAVALVLAFAVASSVTCACGFHDPRILAQGMLNWAYPNALHVTGAVWAAQKEGVLAMPDRARLTATGPARKRLEEEAYWEATRALLALGDELAGKTTGDVPNVSMVLVDPMLWTRFVLAEEGAAVRSHVDGPAEGDLVIITDEPVLHAIDQGTMTIAAAHEMKLARFYGTPEQERAFLDAYGNVGEEPLPEVTQRALLRRLRTPPSDEAGGEGRHAPPQAPAKENENDATP